MVTVNGYNTAVGLHRHLFDVDREGPGGLVEFGRVELLAGIGDNPVRRPLVGVNPAEPEGGPCRDLGQEFAALKDVAVSTTWSTAQASSR